jgi:DNA helicase II / ATP-dependent DNA helicase PcrA
MPNRIEINDADIQLVSQQLKLTLDDAERIAVLKAVKSCDVQAGPGSGKTTVLLAKLAVLAIKWPACDRGICVLSHTNVARREIEQRLSASPELRRLLHYPHFIGTIQTFVDQFLAIPFLRRERVEVTAIDNDRFGARAWAVFTRLSPKGRFAIMRYCGNDADRAHAVVGSLRLDGAHMGITHNMVGANRFPGSDSETGKALIDTKNILRAEGYFRFDDMYAFAEACLFKVSYAAPALRHRFPWVFVDELQDTSVVQDRIIEHIFGVEPCILQKFGDRNQSIFNSDEETAGGPSLFGRRLTLPLSTTHRFGQGIATIVSHLTAVAPQKLVGNPALHDGEHTVFVFDRGSVKLVVPLFGDLVLKSVKPKILKEHGVCVVGGRVNPANHSKDNFPAFLGDYLDGYLPPNSAKPAAPDTFLGYILDGRRKWIEFRTGSEPYAHAVSGVVALFRRMREGDEKDFPKNKTQLHQGLLQAGKLMEFQRIIWALINPVVDLDEKTWLKSCEALINCLGFENHSAASRQFLVWERISAAPLMDKKATKISENVYLHRAGGLELPIRFDSIHGVKGETHAATLVVQTFARQHDLPSILPALLHQTHGNGLRAAVHGHCKRLFVGMSRPRALVCLAISSEHISEKDQASLTGCGWNVVKV